MLLKFGISVILSNWQSIKVGFPHFHLFYDIEQGVPFQTQWRCVYNKTEKPFSRRLPHRPLYLHSTCTDSSDYERVNDSLNGRHKKVYTRGCFARWQSKNNILITFRGDIFWNLAIFYLFCNLVRLKDVYLFLARSDRSRVRREHLCITGI